MQVAEYIVNARRTGVLRSLAFLDRYQGVPGVLYAKPCVPAGAHVRVQPPPLPRPALPGGSQLPRGPAAALPGCRRCSPSPPGAARRPSQVVCKEDGLPTWVCQVLVTKPTLAEAIQWVTEIEEDISRDMPIE